MLAKPEFTTCSRGVISPPWWKQQFFSSASAFLHPPTNEEVVQHPPKKVDKIRERRRRTYFFNFFPGKSWSNFGISAELELWVSRFYITRRRRIKAVALPLHSSFACRNFIYSALPPRRREKGRKGGNTRFPTFLSWQNILIFKKGHIFSRRRRNLQSCAHWNMCVCWWLRRLFALSVTFFVAFWSVFEGHLLLFFFFCCFSLAAAAYGNYVRFSSPPLGALGGSEPEEKSCKHPRPPPGLVEEVACMDTKLWIVVKCRENTLWTH